MNRMSHVLPRLNTTTVVAESLTQLRVDAWHIIAERGVLTGGDWMYPLGIEMQLKAFVRLRDLGALTMTQRRDQTDQGEYFTLLAKVAKGQAQTWGKLLHRELEKLQPKTPERIASL